MGGALAVGMFTPEFRVGRGEAGTAAQVRVARDEGGERAQIRFRVGRPIEQGVQHAGIKRFAFGAMRFGQSGQVALGGAFQERGFALHGLGARLSREQLPLFPVSLLIVEQAEPGRRLRSELCGIVR